MKLQKIQLNYRTHIGVLVGLSIWLPREICFSALFVEEFKGERCQKDERVDYSHPH